MFYNTSKSLIKPGLTRTALMYLMTNGMLLVFESVIGPNCCGKSMLDVGVMPRLFITLHTLNIITVLVNLLPQPHIYINGSLH